MSDRSPKKKDKSENEVEDWLKVVDRLPFVASFKRDVTALRRLLYDRRAPRIAALGMPGSGRTALVNALLSAMTFGKNGALPEPAAGSWVRIDADGRRLDWLELPAELPSDALLELSRRAFDESVPDVIVAVVEAGTEESAAEKVRQSLKTILEYLAEHREKKPPVLVLLSKVDSLPPADGPMDEKSAGIDAGLASLRIRLSEIPKESFVAVCARPLAEDGPPRWNVERIAEEILERLPEAGQVEAVRAFEVGRDAKRRVARTLVNSCTAVAVTVGLAPIPFADAILLLPLQGAMVTGVAYLSGRPWDRRAAAEWLTSIGVVGGAGLGLRWGARQLAKFIPGAGSLIGASVAGAGTLGIGRSAIAYFIDGPGSAVRRPELRAEN